MKSKLLRGALALCLLLSMAFGWTVPAAADEEPEAYNLWIGGVQVTRENREAIAEALTARGVNASGTASYDPDNRVLTLDGFHLSGSGYATRYRFSNRYEYAVESMIYTTDPIQIDFYHDNEITMTTAGASAFMTGIGARADLRITGNEGASLTVRSGSPVSGTSDPVGGTYANIYTTIGIQAWDDGTGEGKNLEISGDCTVTAYGGNDGDESSYYHSRTIGIQARDITLKDGCTVCAFAGNSVRDSYYCAVGLGPQYNLTLANGAELYAYGDQSAITMSTLTLSEGSTGTANTALDGSSGDALDLADWPARFTQNDDTAYRYVYLHSGDSDGGGSGGGGGGSDWPDDPAPYGTPLIEAVNVSGAGGYEVTNRGIEAKYASADQFPEAVSAALAESEQMYRFRYGFMSCATRLLEGEDTPTPIYLRASAEPTTHELMLYGRQKLDPERFTITSGAQQIEPFTGGHYGDGDGILYWYRTVIEIPADSNYIVVMYQQQRAVYLDALRVSGITAAYVTQFYNTGFETDENGNITSFTVEAAGFNLPTSPSAYTTEFGTVRSVTGPDETGKLTLVFDREKPEEVIHWLELRINGQVPVYFDQYKVEEGDGFRVLTCTNDNEFGSPADIPTPYYTLKRGGELDEQSAPYAVLDSENNVLAADIAVYRDSASLFCASYDGNGVLTGLEALGTGTPLTFTAADGAAQVKLLTLDEALAPLHAAKTIAVS